MSSILYGIVIVGFGGVQMRMVGPGTGTGTGCGTGTGSW